MRQTNNRRNPQKPMTDIPKTYSPHEIEEKWHRFWIDRDYFHAADWSDMPSFSIVIPPPNITGSLHIGHALDNALQDVLIRWRRMQGYNTLWMPGTDHAGIVTEIIMEQQLATWGTNREELGREKFIERMWNWKEESRETIINQLQSLGCSCGCVNALPWTKDCPKQFGPRSSSSTKKA